MKNEDDDIPPKPPEIVAKLRWILVNGKKHWGLVMVASLILIGGWLAEIPSGLSFLKTATDSLFRIRIQRTVNDLRLQFREGRDDLPRSGPGGFAKAGQDINIILKLDPRNGNGLYYSGEIKRIKNQSLFTEQSCVRPEELAESPNALDPYEHDFYRYLDIEKTLPDNETTGDYSAEACYSRPSGFCPQRTAWVNHLLANDLFEEAKLTVDPKTKADKFRRAIEHAKAAINLYRDPIQNEGFVQCKPTTVLIAEAKAALK
jgi:hypothetical protein